MNNKSKVIVGDFWKINFLSLILAVLVVMVFGVGAFVYYNNRYPSWYEEVRLSDGRIITVHQKREYYENYGTNQSWVEIDLPELGGKKVWHSYLIPMHVDVQQGQLYVFGRPRGPRQVAHYLYPKYHMVAFQWTGIDFVRVSFMQLPESIRQEENLYSCIPDQKLKVLRIAVKDQRWCDPSGDNGQFVKKINLPAYQELAIGFARAAGYKPISE